METADQPTAVVIPFRLPPSLEAIRRRWDRAAADGAPPHVTVLYPFLPFGELRSEMRDRLVDVTRQVEALDVLFTVVHVEPGLVWIEPHPAEPFVALTAAMTTRWPDYAPYEGRHTEVIPHLTVVNQPGAPVVTLSPTVARWVPFKAQPRRLELCVVGRLVDGAPTGDSTSGPRADRTRRVARYHRGRPPQRRGRSHDGP